MCQAITGKLAHDSDCMQLQVNFSVGAYSIGQFPELVIELTHVLTQLEHILIHTFCRLSLCCTVHADNDHRFLLGR